MIRNLDYAYDGQQRRFIEQIVRAFSGFQYRTGRRNGNDPELRVAPCRMASHDRMVSHIQRNLSDNTLLTVPLITVWQTGLRGRRRDLQNPNHIDARQVIEREVDAAGRYTGQRGRGYLVERLMPLPFQMSVQVDLWTSNLDQKHQLVEQIMTAVYPGFDIQSSDNALDWTALTTVQVEDDLSWSSTSIPIGTENEIDVTSITLTMPFWLSPPARVTQLRRIEQIVTNIDAMDQDGDRDFGQPGSPVSRIVTSPGNHHLRVANGAVTLLGPKAAEQDADGRVHDWASLIERYGTLRPAVSRLHLKTSDDPDDGHDIVGTLQPDAQAPNGLFWQIDPDTLPRNTLPPVDAVIDPLRTRPGTHLPPASAGQRYLLLAPVVNDAAWGGLSARANDIIECTAHGWTVGFASAQAFERQHVLNLHSGTQLRWAHKDQDWVLAIDGVYAPGQWRLWL